MTDILKKLKTITTIFEILCRTMITVLIVELICQGIILSFENNKLVNAEIIEIVDTFTEENPFSYSYNEKKEYSYMVKYEVQGQEITSLQPIKNSQILNIGDTIKLQIDGNNGYIIKSNPTDKINDFLLGITLTIFTFIMLKTINKSIIILLEEDKNILLFNIKKIFFEILSKTFLFCGILLIITLIFTTPQYLNHDYTYVTSELTGFESAYESQGNMVYEYILKYEYKDRWFEVKDYFVPDTQREIRDKFAYLIDTETGLTYKDTFSEFYKEYYPKTAIIILIGIILKLIDINLSKKKKELMLKDTLQTNEENPDNKIILPTIDNETETSCKDKQDSKLKKILEKCLPDVLIFAIITYLFYLFILNLYVLDFFLGYYPI